MRRTASVGYRWAFVSVTFACDLRPCVPFACVTAAALRVNEEDCGNVRANEPRGEISGGSGVLLGLLYAAARMVVFAPERR